jgi:hypothetical protein
MGQKKIPFDHSSNGFDRTHFLCGKFINRRLEGGRAKYNSECSCHPFVFIFFHHQQPEPLSANKKWRLLRESEKQKKLKQTDIEILTKS